jgi:hypothetical protein
MGRATVTSLGDGPGRTIEKAGETQAPAAAGVEVATGTSIAPMPVTAVRRLDCTVKAPWTPTCGLLYGELCPNTRTCWGWRGLTTLNTRSGPQSAPRGSRLASHRRPLRSWQGFTRRGSPISNEGPRIRLGPASCGSPLGLGSPLANWRAVRRTARRVRSRIIHAARPPLLPARGSIQRGQPARLGDERRGPLLPGPPPR